MSGPSKGAMVGFGFIAQNGHLPAYRASGQFEVVAVADPCEARRAAAARAIPGVRVYADHAALLASEGDGISFVDVTAPPAFHAAAARAALRRGKDVLCEKPLAVTSEEARTMISEARASGAVLFPVQNYKHAPSIRAVTEAIDSGAIGRPRLMTVQTFRPTHARGVREWREHWRRDPGVSGGGIAMDHGSHAFYLAFSWMGGLARSVSATTSRLGGDVEDSLRCTLCFASGNAAVDLTWIAGVRKSLYTVHGECGAIRVEDDLVEVSMLERDGQRPLTTSSRSARAFASRWSDAGHAEWFLGTLSDFAHARATRAIRSDELMQALACVETIEAAYASALRGGASVRVPLGAS